MIIIFVCSQTPAVSFDETFHASSRQRDLRRLYIRSHTSCTRCKKNSWEKPVIETVSARPIFPGNDLKSILAQRKHGNGWSFVVVLIRLVHKRGFDGDRETVRLEPHPPYVCPTVQEAQHWGATYALYRVRLHLSISTNSYIPLIIYSSFATGSS